jgi:proteasome lid subunit RPN8/RPN11
MLTDDGQTIIGREIYLRDLRATLGNLEAAGAKLVVTNEQLIKRILKSGFKYKLSNGWFLERDTVNREHRVRLKGVSGFGRIGDQLKSDGLFTEVVQSETRFYIPTKASVATKVLDRVLEGRDLVEEIAPEIIAEERGAYQQREDGNAETRRMGENLLEITANLAEAPKQRPGGIETVATAINAELIADQSTSLFGKVVKTGEDLATLAQVYRDPRYETMRFFLTDADGKIVYSTAVSARLPGATAAFAMGESVENLAHDIRRSRGVTNLWMLHNHPSGKATPSGTDQELTMQIMDELTDLGVKVTVDHVVINSNEFSHMQALKQGTKPARLQTRVSVKHDFGEDLLLQAAMPHPLLNKHVGTSSDIADIGAALHKGAGWITVIGVTSRSETRAFGEIHESALGDNKLLKKYLREFAQAHGARDLYLVGVREELIFKKGLLRTKGQRWARDLVALGYVRDVIGTDYQSLTNRDNVVEMIDVQLGMQVRESTQKVVREERGSYESDVTKNQEEIVEKVKKGQPLDRIMRFMFVQALSPFGVFGEVLNERGEFKMGLAALNRVKKFLGSATFSDDSPFRFMNGHLEHARMGLIDRHGVPEEFIQRGFEATAQQRKLLREGLEFINRLFEAGVTSLQESIIIQKMLTGKDLDGHEAEISTAEWEGLAGEIRAAVEALGLEAVNLGLVSRESYERNKGTYLHRVYTEYELGGKDKTLSRFMGSLVAGKKHQIKGDEMKGRGIFQEVTQGRLLKDISSPDVQDFFGIKKRRGKPDETLLTKKFRILDLYDEGKSPGNQTLPGIEDTPLAHKLKKRLIVPADAPIDLALGNYEDRGVYEVRRIVGDKLVLWRDFTKAERVQMGEILDARYTIAKTYHVLAQDLASARFFKDIAANEEWTWERGSNPPDEIVAKASSALRHYVGFEWVQVPSDPITKTGGKKRWGALAGRYVRAEIWKDLTELDAMNQKGPWQKLLTQWKLNKTARHPVVHMNNVMSNLTLMDLIDVRARDLWRGINEYNDRGELYQLARDHGGFGASYIDQEIKDEILTPILSDMSKEAKKGLYEEGTFLKKLMFVNQYSRMASEGIQRLGKLIGDFDRASVEWYRTEDEVFRMAIFIRRMELGDSPHEAAALAREQMLNYDIRAPWVNSARRSVLPFIAYTYRAVPAIAEAMVRRPWKFAKYALLAEMANSLAYAVSDGDEEWERASLRPETQGSVWVGGAPRMMRMPYNDKHGNPVFLDIRRWIPAGDVFDVSPNNPLPIPAWLHFGGPVMIAAEFLLNKQAFTGTQIVDPNIDSLGDKTKKYGAFAYRSFMPSAPWIYESWYWQKIARAVSGGRDAIGRDYTLGSALLSSTGIKATGHDVELNFEYRSREFDRTERALKYALRLNRRDLARGLIKADEARRIETDHLDKLKRLNENRRKTFAPLMRRDLQ